MSKIKKPEPLETVPFEQALSRLEELVRILEDGEIGLDESLDCYEEGIRHLKHCFQRLEQAERRIELVTGTDASGNPVVRAFEETTAASPAEGEALPPAGRRIRTPKSGGVSRRSSAMDDAGDVDAGNRLF